jgi:RHS repeat-associated protein
LRPGLRGRTLENVVGAVDALRNATTYQFDGAGRSTLRIDGRGLRTSYVYDAADRLTGQLYQDGTRVTMGYDANSRRTHLSDWTGSYTSSFDPVNRLSSAVNPAGIAFTYGYDAMGQRAWMAQPTGTFTYSFDPVGRISTVLNPENQTTSWSYDAASRVRQSLLANGVTISNTYDAADRLLLLANLGSGGTTLSSFNYTYNAVGNRMQVLEATGNVVTWSYDRTCQLTNEQRSGANAYNITYAYDPVGERTLLLNGGAATTSTYNAANELVTSQSSAGVTSITYDGNGNLLTTRAPGNQWTTNTWDGENRLARAALPSGIVDSFTYNGDGQRVQKQDSTGTTNHVWDEQNIILETNASNIIQVVYTLEPAYYGNLISQSRSGVDSFYLFDALGSTGQLTSGAGGVTDSYLYDSFGNTLLASGSTTNWFRYVGRIGYYYDADLAKFYLRARIYDPTQGRFCSRDPLYNAALRNLYEYAELRPTTYVDPSGMEPCSETYWTSESCLACPPCPCSESKTGSVKPGANGGFPIGELGHTVIQILGGCKCDVAFKIANCGLPGVSWTCAKGSVPGKRKIFICISEDLNQCQIEIILYHECTHAIDFCNQPPGPAGIYDCKKQETAAYTASCTREAQMECIPAAEQKAKIQKCINFGVNEISCKPPKPGEEPRDPCKTDLPRVFPGS